MENDSFVLDIHIWISIFHNNYSERLIDALIEKQFTLYASTELQKEFLHVAHYPEIKKLLPEKISFYSNLIEQLSIFIEPEKRFALVADYKDNYLVDCAMLSKATIVSNDKHLKFLKKLKHPSVKVISQKDFYSALGW